MSRLFDLDLQLLADSVLTMIAVLVLFVLASYLLFNPVREFLKKRQDKIKSADEILSAARKKALANEAKIVAEAKEEAARIIARANEEATLEKKRAVDDVKKEMITIASAMAAKVVSASIDTTIQDSLVEETLKEMGDTTWLS